MVNKRHNDDTFMKITNQDVYRTMEKGFIDLNKKLDDFADNNNRSHDDIKAKQDKTNGKVKLNKWVATTALALITTLIFLLMSGLIGGN